MGGSRYHGKGGGVRGKCGGRGGNQGRKRGFKGQVKEWKREGAITMIEKFHEVGVVCIWVRSLVNYSVSCFVYITLYILGCIYEHYLLWYLFA